MSDHPGTFVDSSVLLDVFTEDEHWVQWSESALTNAISQGPLVINHIVLAEIAPRFPKLEDLMAHLPKQMLLEGLPTSAAFLSGHAHATYRRKGGTRTQILPDFLIAAHAGVTKRPLLTRDPKRISTYLPGVSLISP